MERREFITVLGGATAWPLTGLAQQSPLPVIGWLGARAAHESAYLVGAFRQGLKEAGFIESQNVTLDFRWAKAITIDCLCMRWSWRADQ
jgi:putative ABC transport system substrate-binding protein